jgi:hypothetical protein
MRNRIVFSDLDIAEIVRLYRDTFGSTRTIATAFGCSQNTINRALREAGVVPNVSEKLSQQRRGQPSNCKGVPKSLTEEQRAAARERATGNQWCVGRKLSPESLARMRASAKGINVRFTPEERKLREAVRQASKRFLHRVLRATGRRKLIPSEAHLGYSKDALVAHLGPKPCEDAHIDHYVPIVEFLRRGIVSPAVINALPNLRWLGADLNRRKSASVPGDADSVIARCIAAGGATYAKGV